MRIFKPMPSVEIPESAATQGKNVAEVGRVLASLGHPQCLTGTTRETQRGDDTIVEWLPKAGTKG